MRARREFAQELGALGRAGGHEGSILAAQDKTRAHLDVARHDRLIVDPGHSGKFAVLARVADAYRTMIAVGVSSMTIVKLAALSAAAASPELAERKP